MIHLREVSGKCKYYCNDIKFFRQTALCKQCSPRSDCSLITVYTVLPFNPLNLGALRQFFWCSHFLDFYSSWTHLLCFVHMDQRPPILVNETANLTIFLAPYAIGHSHVNCTTHHTELCQLPAEENEFVFYMKIDCLPPVSDAALYIILQRGTDSDNK